MYKMIQVGSSYISPNGTVFVVIGFEVTFDRNNKPQTIVKLRRVSPSGHAVRVPVALEALLKRLNDGNLMECN
jgi:hypothetical protein